LSARPNYGKARPARQARSAVKAGPRSRAPAAGAAAFAGPDHDHRACVDDALAEAVARCRANGVRLTDQRRRVLELVWRAHTPVGAYALLERMREDGIPAQPPTVYRALDFLVDNGLVHRIESLNAFVGCARPDSAHVGQFLICAKCRATAELAESSIQSAIAGGAAAVGFTVLRATVEVSGLCPNCRHPGA
jgi:Fur family zinc uptake transcriptional regulator